jgi:hypothetical protein
VVDLDVAVSIITAVELVEVKPADRAGRPVDLYGPCAVFLASLVGDVLDYPLASFAVGYLLFVYRPVDHVVYLPRVFGNPLAPVGREEQLVGQSIALVIEDLLDKPFDGPEVLLDLVEPLVGDPSEALLPAVEVALEVVEGLVDFDGLGQEVHVLPRPTVFVLVPDASCEPLVLVLGQYPAHVVVGAVIDAKHIVAPLHGLPGGGVPKARNGSPCVETPTLSWYPFQFFVVGLGKGVEHDCVVDGVLYRVEQVLPSLGVRCSKDEYLGHHAYSVYLEDLPLTSSAGYF